LDEKERAEIIESTRRPMAPASKKAKIVRKAEVKGVKAAKEELGGANGVLPKNERRWSLEDLVALANNMVDSAKEEEEDYAALKCRKAPVCLKVSG
jgi:hypothetical protein